MLYQHLLSGHDVLVCRFFKRKFLFYFLLPFCCISSSWAQLSVSNVATLNYSGGGEIQSAVIPPGVKTQCPKGRVLISRDGLRPPMAGLIVSRDMDNPAMPAIEATFDNVPNPADYSFGTNDHDLITLPNGDVLYITGAFSKRPIDPKPSWFDATYRNTFGPGARSVVLTWRSTDAGKTFQFLSEFDPAKVENGVPAYPQFGPTGDSPPWDMGGTDGQLVKSAPGSDLLYMTYGIVGYNTKTDTKNFTPDKTNKVNKTVLLVSKGGNSWTSLGMMDGFFWRLSMAPLPNNSVETPVAFTGMYAGNNIFMGKKTSPLHFSFDAASPTPNGTFRYAWRPEGTLKKWVYTNVTASAVIARLPGGGNNLLFVYPASLDGGENGCKVYFYNTSKDEYGELEPIMPEDHSVNGYIIHPTIIDSKNGALLLYWYDMNGKNLKAKIKGRIISSNSTYTEDFNISEIANKPYSFDLTHKLASDNYTPVDSSYWYGDYHTADGYTEMASNTQNGISAKTTVHFFPVWVQPDFSIRYAEVSYTYEPAKPKIVIPYKEINLAVKEIPPHIWTRSLRHIELKRLTPVKLRIENEQLERTNKKLNVRGN